MMLGKMVRRNYAQIRTLIPGSAHMTSSSFKWWEIEKNKAEKRSFSKYKLVRLWLSWFFNLAWLILYLGIQRRCFSPLYGHPPSKKSGTELVRFQFLMFLGIFWYFEDFQWFLIFWIKNFLGGMANTLRYCVHFEQVAAFDPKKQSYSGSLRAELFKAWRIGSRAYELAPGWAKWDSMPNNKVRTLSGTECVLFCDQSDKWLQKHPKIGKSKGKKCSSFKCKLVLLWLNWFFGLASRIWYLGVK